MKAIFLFSESLGVYELGSIEGEVSCIALLLFINLLKDDRYS